MTSAGTIPVSQLLQLKDDEFDTTIKDMGQRNLMEAITGLQKEMAKEQENFNSMSEELKGFRDRNSRQYKQISKDLMASQTRLTSLMNKSMKCFAQQNLQQGKDGITVRRRNSAKGTNPNSPTKIVQRSQSMYIPQEPNLTLNLVAPPEPTTIRTGSNQNINRISVVNSNLKNTHNPGSKSTSNIIRVTNPNKPFKVSHNFSPVSNPSSPLSQNFNNSPAKKSILFNSKPDEMKTSISIASKNAVITSSTANSSSDQSYTQINSNNDEAENVPSVRKLAQSFGNSKQPNAPPRPNRSTILNRNFSISNQNLSHPQKVNGVQSSLQNGELSSQQRKVVQQSVNISGKNNMVQSRPVSVVNSRDTTPQRQNVELIPKAHSVQNLTSDSNDNVKTTLTVSFGNKSENESKNVLKNDLKNSENRHSWFGQKGDLLSEIESGKNGNNLKPIPKTETTKTVQSNQSGRSTTVNSSVTIKTVSSDHSQINGQERSSENVPTQKLNITSVSSKATNQTDDDKPKHPPINLKKDLTNGETGEDDVVEVTPRMNLISWDPVKLIKKLYHVKLIEETAEDISYQYVSMEGFMEKLPMNKKKATLLKTWKRRFFKAKDGWLHYYESSNRDKPSDSLQLMGGKILEMTDLGSRILGIDDGRGKFLMVRVPSDKEYGQWKLAFDSQMADNTKAGYLQPVLYANPHPKKKVLVVDMGSSSIRAGLLGEQASLPQLFFPCVASVNKTTGDIIIGADAYKPENRSNGNLVYPVHPSNKIDKFTIDWKVIKVLFQKIFTELKINPSQYWVMLSTPQSLGDNLKEGLMEVFINQFNMCGVCMVQQSLLSLYSYKATSGIIVDIGQRIEILPIYDGFVISGGVSKLPYGSDKIQNSLTQSLLENNYSFQSTIEQLIVRYIMEQSCYVASHYKNELSECKNADNKITTTVKLDGFDLPPTAYSEVKYDEGRFKSTEGLFDTDMWEMDFPNLHKLVFQAIQMCPMDNRRHMYRAIYLSGGVSMLPGFADRFKIELTKLAPPGVPIEVHASQNRYHAAYIGASSVAGMNEFEMMCIDRNQWKYEGKKAFRKWQAPTV